VRALRDRTPSHASPRSPGLATATDSRRSHPHRTRKRCALEEQVTAVHQASSGTYGAKSGHRRTPRHWRGDEPQHAASSDGQALRSPASAPGGSARRPPRLTRKRSTRQTSLPGSSTRRILACPLRIGRHLPPPPRPDGLSLAWCATSTRARVLGWSVAEHVDATLVRGCP